MHCPRLYNRLLQKPFFSLHRPQMTQKKALIAKARDHLICSEQTKPLNTKKKLSLEKRFLIDILYAKVIQRFSLKAVIFDCTMCLNNDQLYTN